MEDALAVTIRFIGYVIFDLFLYSTARLVLPLLSFGWLRSSPLSGGRFLTPLVQRQADGTRQVSPELSITVGLSVWSAIGAAVIAALR